MAGGAIASMNPDRIVIALSMENRTQHGAHFVGTRPRFAGATSVKFVDRHRLLYASLLGRRLYLARFDWPSRSHEVVAIVDEKLSTDLIDFDGRDRIATSNCEDPSVSLYRLVGDEIVHARDVPIRDPGAGYCHGAGFVPGRPDLLCATCNTGECRVYFLSAETGEVVYAFQREWKPKDVGFIDASRVVVLYVEGDVTRRPSDPYRSKVALLHVDVDRRQHRVLSEVVVEGHLDNFAHCAGRLYVSDQAHDLIVQFHIDGDELILDREIPGYDMPHGVDALAIDEGTLLAVTNYGSNTVDVRLMEP